MQYKIVVYDTNSCHNIQSYTKMNVTLAIVYQGFIPKNCLGGEDCIRKHAKVGGSGGNLQILMARGFL